MGGPGFWYKMEEQQCYWDVTLDKVTISEGTGREYIEKKQGTAASGRKSKPVGISYQWSRVRLAFFMFCGEYFWMSIILFIQKNIRLKFKTKAPMSKYQKNPSPKTSIREQECSIAQFTLSTMHTCVKTSDCVCHKIQCKFKNSPNKDNDIHSKDYCKDWGKLWKKCFQTCSLFYGG